MHAVGTISLATEIPGPRSRELWRRRQALIPRGVSSASPIFAAAASGAALTDVDGNVYVDFTGGIGVLNVGHAPREVVDAVSEQAERLLHTCFMVAPYEGYLAVVEEIAALVPGSFPKKGLLVNSGAEAVENAVKIARHATGRQAVVVFSNSFHGRTLLTMSMTAKEATYKHGFGPFAPEVYRVPFPYPYHGISAEFALEEFRRVLHDEVGERNVAAVVMELVQGEGGFLPAPRDFVTAVLALCRQHGILFVDDEIQTGFCRTGQMFAVEHYGVEPDLLCFAKSIAAGLPLAGVVGRADIMDSPQPGGLGSTFGGNPVACAAALAALEVMQRDHLAARAAHVGAILMDRLRVWRDEFDLVGDVRGLGAMVAAEFTRDGSDREPAVEETDVIVRDACEHGLLVLKAGTHNNVIRFLAPLVITDEQLAEGLDVLEGAVRRTAAASGGVPARPAGPSR